jgi:type II secretory pathway pseudopilin PulG
MLPCVAFPAEVRTLLVGPCSGHIALDAGFTLLETLVSFAMLALFLTITFAGLSQSLRADRHVEMYQRAVVAAQSKLARIGITEPISPGEASGLSDGLNWTSKVSPAWNDGKSSGYWVTVTVSSPETVDPIPPVTLMTFRRTERRP